MFLSERDFATVVNATPLISIDLIVENAAGDVLLGQRTNRPAQGYWFVPGGRVQKNETLADAFLRLTEAELGEAIPVEQGQFHGVWQHFYPDSFAGEEITTHYVVLGYRLQLKDDARALPQAQHARYRWQSPQALIASDDVHANSRAYFDPALQGGVPGLTVKG